MLMQALLRCGAEYHPGSSVWNVDRDGSLGVTQGGHARIVRARRVLLATGAQERAHPFPGWTLPGVMTAGAAQVLLKSAAAVPSGPRGAGRRPGRCCCWRRHAAAARGSPDRGAVGHGPARRQSACGRLPAAGAASAGLPGQGRVPATGTAPRRSADAARRHPAARHRRRTVAGSRGGGATPRSGVSRRTRLLVHFGVVPNTVFTRLLRIEHRWDHQAALLGAGLRRLGRHVGAGGRPCGGMGPGYSAAGRQCITRAGLRRWRRPRTRWAASPWRERDHLAVAGAAGASQAPCAVRPFLDALFRPPDWLAQATPLRRPSCAAARR